MKPAATFLVFALLASSWTGSPLFAGEDHPNSHIQVVLRVDLLDGRGRGQMLFFRLS